MPTLAPDHDDRMARVRLALLGLAVGDGFGGRFFRPADGPGALPRPPWPTSDDTEMARGVVDALERDGRIDPDALAVDFARRYRLRPDSGYGLTARRILEAIAGGTPWPEASTLPYGGLGSMGNGAAMRAAPIGAYYHDDPAAAAGAARLSALPTHAHPEGQAGAIAVAVAAAWAARTGTQTQTQDRDPRDLLRAAIDRTPPGPTRSGIEAALDLDPAEPIGRAAEVLGNGSKITAPDTVPFALWCAARHLGDYQATLWSIAAAGGDNDTNGAIAGALAALAAGPGSIPQSWIEAIGPLPGGD